MAARAVSGTETPYYAMDNALHAARRKLCLVSWEAEREKGLG